MILCESDRRSFQHGEVAIQTFCFMKCRIDTFNVGWPVRRSRDRADHQRPGVRWQTVAAVREHNLLNLGAGPWLVARTKQIWRLFKSHKSVKIQRFQPKLIMSNCPPITQRNGPKVQLSYTIQYFLSDFGVSKSERSVGLVTEQTQEYRSVLVPPQ